MSVYRRQALQLDAAGRFEERNGLPEVAYPEWKVNFNLDWSYGNFGASVNVDYIGNEVLMPCYFRCRSVELTGVELR